MSIPLEAIVGDLHIVSGVRQPMTLPTATFQPPRRAARGRAGDRLFVLVELRPPDLGADAEVAYGAPYNKVIDQIAAGYWRTEGSVTAALRGAITAANDWLMDYNLESQVRERFRAGITCVVMREADVFIAQAGPAACYVAHQGQLERFPSRDVTATALGASRGVEVRYGHAELHPGDVVLLCDSATAERAPDETITQAIVYVGVPAALTNLEKLAASGDLIALVIEGAAVGSPIHTEPAPPVAPSRPAPKAPPPVVEPELSEPDVIPEIARPPEERGPSLRDRVSDMWARLRRPVTAAGQALPRADLQERFRQVVRSIVIGLVVAGRNAQTFFRSMLPEPAAHPARETPGRNNLIGAILVILIAVLVTLLVVSLYLQRLAQAKFDSLLGSALAAANVAQTTLDERAARDQWLKAWQLAGDSLGYKPSDARAQGVRKQALDQLDRINRTTRVKATLIYPFGVGDRYRVAAQGSNVFVMNAKYIWHITLNESGTGLSAGGTPSPSAYAGASIGGRQIGDLQDMVWVTASGLRTKSSLLILNTGDLLEYDPAWNIQVVPLGQGEARPGLRLIDTFGGNLYVMDNSQLWRYEPQGDGFGTPSKAYFNASPGDLSTVTDLAIDGNVYLLYADGHVREFFGGEEQSFTPTDLPPANTRPVALSVDANAPRKALYVAEVGQAGADAAGDDRARVMQFTPQGIFVRQIQTYDNAMDALESIFVDERSQRLFFLSGGGLYVASLIPAQMP